MDLHIIHVLQLNTMFARNATRIAGEAWEVRRVLVEAADAAGCHDREARANAIRIALHVFCDNASAQDERIMISTLSCLFSPWPARSVSSKKAW